MVLAVAFPVAPAHIVWQIVPCFIVQIKDKAAFAAIRANVLPGGFVKGKTMLH